MLEMLKTTKSRLIAISLLSFIFVGLALYLQHVANMAPCPLCIAQRYLYVLLGLLSLLAAILPRNLGERIIAFLCMLVSLAGVAAAGWHVYVAAHHEASCGIDPLETFLNIIPTAAMFPYLFKADGVCSTPYDPLLWLSIPQWSLLSFSVFSVVLIHLTFKRRW